MEINNICYVTAFYDIGRDNWENFNRSVDTYFNNFKPFINLFDTTICENDEMICFIDDRYISFLETLLEQHQTNITLIPLNLDLLNELYIWKSLEIERQNMNRIEFKQLIGERYIYPETIYPEYTLINHCKIDLISRVIDLNMSDKNYYAWVDFGFFGKVEFIPNKLLDINKFNLETMNFWLINPIQLIDSNIYYNLAIAPERIGGFFFLGNKNIIKIYQQLYHDMLYHFQNILHIADDDQCLHLMIFFQTPELFSFNMDNYGWHKVLVVNQKI
jgi:hypothetical protein